MSLHIVFVEPEIPPNTGNIARTCAATGASLHLVEPMGFSVDDREVKRAGLDYWPFVDVTVYKNLDEFFSENKDKRKFFVSTRGENLYTDFKYKDGDMFLFGKETKGLDKDLLAENREHAIRVPMGDDERLRSLNLANSANIVLYEALRQLGFPGLV